MLQLDPRHIRINLNTAKLCEEIIKNREGRLSNAGSIVVRPGNYRELSIADRFIVHAGEKKATWSDNKNQISPRQFSTLLKRVRAYIRNKDLYIQDCIAGAGDYRTPVRIATATAWHSLYAHHKYRRDIAFSYEEFKPEFTLIHIPRFHAIPEIDGTRSQAFVVVNLSDRLAIIGGTSCAGEIKQVVFTICNYTMPKEKVFLMRCSANIGTKGDVAIFLGRERTGKTTLGVDPKRHLVADHFLGWSERGLFSLENGGDAKCFGLLQQEEPEIHACTQKFASILENVAVDPDTGEIDLSDGNFTENTKVIYPLHFIPNTLKDGVCGHPNNIFLLTCDALGVLPPIAKLTPELAVFAFLTNYTSQFTQKPGYMEREIMFDVCFGDSLLALPPHIYGEKLLEKIHAHNINCWVVNTGWTGEPCQKSERVKISLSRTLVKAAISGELDKGGYQKDPIFQYDIPRQCPGVSPEILDPRLTACDQGEYEARANYLAHEFMKDFAKFENNVPLDMRVMLSHVIVLSNDAMDLENFGFSM